jgi:arginyl-tRNA synthetase
VSPGTALIRDRLAELVGSAVARAQTDGYLPTVAMPDVSIERPTRPELGDFATSFALRAKRAVGPQGPNPMTIAGAISAAIANDPPSYLATVEVAPPGFLNFTLADDWVRQQVDVVLAANGHFGALDLGHGRRVQVEFVSANPTGPMHVGTGRNAALGDSVARILGAAGWDVQREYYYNDAGAQMAHLSHSVWVRYQQAFGRDVALAETDYPGEYIRELAQEIKQLHGDRFLDLPEAQAEELGAIATQAIMRWIEAELIRLRVVFDSWFSEARVIRDGDFDAVMDLLGARGFVYEREGALWLRSSELGDERDRVLIRSDGRPTYTATDIAYHYDKLFVRHFDRVIDVWGADHQGQVPSMQAILTALGAEPGQFEVLLYQLVNVLQGGQPVRMGKRAGNVITVSEVLDEVGVDAMRWFLVSRSADAMMDFDVDLAKRQSSDNPVYYVQYAHARLARILDEAAQRQIDWHDASPAPLIQPTELALIRRMLQFPEVVELAARQLAPHHMPHYAYELARATQAWYEAGNDDPALRVLGVAEPVQAARLKLAEAARLVLAAALGLIGVDAPRTM